MPPPAPRSGFSVQPASSAAPPPSQSSTFDAVEVKQRAVQMFFDIHAADRRLQAAGDRASLSRLVEPCFTFDVLNNKHVFQAAQLFDTLTSRGVPAEPLMQALMVLEPRLNRLNVISRAPDAIRRLTPTERQELLKKAPPSSSPYLDELDKKSVPAIIQDARKAPARRRSLIPIAGVVFVLLVVGIVLSIPKIHLTAANVAFPADAVPCISQRTANSILFCVVDETPLANEDDVKIHARMAKALAVAQKEGFKQVAFLKKGLGADGEQHRYKPNLWERDPKAPTSFVIPVKKATTPAPPTTK